MDNYDLWNSVSYTHEKILNWRSFLILTSSNMLITIINNTINCMNTQLPKNVSPRHLFFHSNFFPVIVFSLRLVGCLYEVSANTFPQSSAEGKMSQSKLRYWQVFHINRKQKFLCLRIKTAQSCGNTHIDLEGSFLSGYIQSNRTRLIPMALQSCDFGQI